MASYITFLELSDKHGLPIGVCIAGGILAGVVVALAFQYFVLRLLATAAPIVRLISTLGLLVVVQSAVELRYGKANHPVLPYLPHDTFDWGGVFVQEQVLYIIGVTFVVTFALWAFAKYSRIGLAITASAQNERAVQTMGWSPNKLAVITWGMGAALAGLAGVLLAPLTGLSTITFTLIVTVTAMAAALLGGFRSFPLTLLGGFVVGLGEAAVTRYRFDIQDFIGVGDIPGLERAIPFLLILLVLVVRGRGLPLRSHVSDRLPKLGTGRINVPGLLLVTGIVVLLLETVMDDRWATATYISRISAIVVLSIVVLTGYAGQLSLGQWALAGCGALIAGSFVLRLDFPFELALPLGVLLTIPVGLLFALPALRTRGVNLAIVTLGLGFTIQAVVFAKTSWIAQGFDAGTTVGSAKLFGWKVDGATHPHRWALVCIIAFVACALVVANLRRSRTGRRLIAVRTNERAAASLGISVFGVKLYAFSVAAAIAGLAGILLAFRGTIITYEQYSPLQSIFSVGWAVIGGLGFVIGAVFSAPNAIGGLGTRIIEDVLSLGDWDALVGGVILLLIIVFHQDGIAEVVTRELRPLLRKIRLLKADPVPAPLPEPDGNGRTGDAVGREPHGPLRWCHRGRPRDLRGRARRGRRADRSERRRQDDDHRRGHRVREADRGRRDVQHRSDQPVVGHQARASRPAPVVPVARALRGHQRRRQHPGRRRHPRTVSWFTDLVWPGKHALASTAVSAIHEFDLEPTPPETSRRAAVRASPTGRHRARWRPAPRSSCSTSPRPASTRPRATSSRRSSAASPTTGAWACCSSSTTSAS